jgi:hypothetical protein
MGLESVGENFDINFVMKEFPIRQTIHTFVNKLRPTGLLIDKKQKHKCQAFTEEKLNDTGAKLEHTPRKSAKCLAQEIGVLKSSARTTTKLLKLRSSKKTAIHALQLCDPASRIHFCRWFLQSVVEGEIDLKLTFFLDEGWFHLQDT